jgi:hypothetical protein
VIPIWRRAQGWAIALIRRDTAARLLRAGWPGLAAAVVVLLALIAASEYARLRVLTASLNALSARLADQQTLLAVVASPTARTVVLHGDVPGTVRFVFDVSADRGALIADGLRDPGADRVYQLWLVDDEAARSAGTFRAAPAQPVFVPVRTSLQRYRRVVISVEPAPHGALGGPTSAPVLTASL